MTPPAIPPPLPLGRTRSHNVPGEEPSPVEQAGRSPTVLYAHQSSASLASLASGAQSPQQSRPLLSNHSRAGSTASSHRGDYRTPLMISPVLPTDGEVPAPTAPGSEAPTEASVHSAASSPAEEKAESTTPSEEERVSPAAGRRQQSGIAALGGPAAAAAIARASHLPLPGRPSAPRESRLSSRSSSTNSRRAPRPQSLRELGSDYTRYFDPGHTPSRSNSRVRGRERPHRPEAINGGPRAGPPDGRLSNPFDDKKRIPVIHSEEAEDEEAEQKSEKQSAAETAGIDAPDQKGVEGNAEFVKASEPAEEDLKDEEQALSEKRGLDQDSSSEDKAAGAVVSLAVPPASQANAYRALDEKTFFPYLDDRLAAPGAEAAGYTFPLLWHETEPDDDMHMPSAEDDVNMRPTWKDRLSRENIVSLLGMALMAIGCLMLFLVLPILSSTGLNMIDYAYDFPASDFPAGGDGPAWARVNNKVYPLLKNVRTGLIDPDTPKSAMTKTSQWDGEKLNLVFSDEFNDNNRTFYKGDDPFFYAFDGWYSATKDLEWYDPDAVTTYDGVLELRLDQFANHNLNYRSGMLNSWNQLCFKGGIWEVSVSLPAPAGVHGLWPGVWSMGNLGRPGYLASTDGMWPYTYSSCDVGITPNQSMTDGTSYLPGQRLTSCTCPNSDHPTPKVGRGAPEIDILEGAADYGGHGWSTATQSYQVAPFDIWYYPDYEYFMTPNYSLSYVNTYTGGPYQQAVSTTSVLNNAWTDGQAYQTYAYDYKPGTGEDSWIAWLVGDEVMAGFDGRAIGPNGNIQSRIISQEPMSMIMNLGISNSWTTIDFAKLVFPAVMRIDYVRLYQRDGEESVTCDPPGWETTDYIAKHPAAYQNMNVTHWTEAGYDWPKNKFMHGC